MWDVIVCTCQNTESAVSSRKELEIRQQKGLLSKDAVLLAVEDPKANIGSGSACLNALLCVAEFLAAREGMTAVSEDVLSKTRVLILLLGTTFPFSPCGHGFMPHPTAPQHQEAQGFKQTEIRTNFDDLIEFLGDLCENTPPGVWVASTDMLLTVSGEKESLSAECFEDGIVVMTVTSSPEHAMLHGVCKITETGEFARIIHRGGIEQVRACSRPDNLSDILAGLVYFNRRVTGMLLRLHTTPPLDACTYAGLDNGAEPLSLSLFFDILLCLTTEISCEDYVTGSFKTSSNADSKGPIMVDPVQQRARSVLWKALRGLKMKAVRLPWVQHHYLRLVASDVLSRYTGEGGKPCVINSIIPKGTTIGNNSLLINCNLENPISVGSGSFLTGLGKSFSDQQNDWYPRTQLRLPDDVTVHEIQVTLGAGRTCSRHGLVVVYGVHDNMLAVFDSPGATFFNKPWQRLFEKTGITETDLWLPGTPKTLLRARLFVVCHASLEVGVRESFWLLSNQQDLERLHRWRFSWRISLSDILCHVDCQEEFSKLRSISFELQCQKMIKVLKENEPVSFLPFLHHALIEDRQLYILETLDLVAQEVSDPLVVCRVYASIADMLGCMAGEGGIRAGPAANITWRSAFALLEEGKLVAATKALALERGNWIHNGPDRVIRACRHYERAGQILTRIAVATAKRFIQCIPSVPPDVGQTITVYAPSRIDLAGGWTDTPPQAYEWGGVVTTLALIINNEYPIQVAAERIPEFKLELVILGEDGVIVDQLELTELSHLANYSQPHAPGALLKAAFICAEIVDFPSEESLAVQLGKKFGCGIKLRSLSNIPQGSGLGTSSILGGAILAALWKVTGQEHSHDSLIHAVLYLEQLLTTGGGWQDQCGGLYGGAKISQSAKGLPVHIVTEQIETPPGFIEKLNQHLVLVYTGKTRLARNLLQDVVRNWHSREEKIVKNMRDLVDNAWRAQAALKRGDLVELGACLDDYQNQKLVMAPGSMPKVVAVFLEKIRDQIHGCSFAGAGGGGFMSIICKAANGKEKLMQVIRSNKVLEDFVVYNVKVDMKGLHHTITSTDSHKTPTIIDHE